MQSTGRSNRAQLPYCFQQSSNSFNRPASEMVAFARRALRQLGADVGDAERFHPEKALKSG